MLATYKELITNQFEAALSTLAICIEKCPEGNWRKPVLRPVFAFFIVAKNRGVFLGNLEFNQAAFHALFYVDVYLSEDYAAAIAQPFHQGDLRKGVHQ